MRNPHVPPGFWRGVNVNQNAIYLECFMDELAHAVGQDPVAFRRKLMSKHPKHLAVLNAVAEKIGWDKPAPQGIFRGIAQHMGYASYRRGRGGNLGDRRQQDQGASHRRRHRPRLRRQSGADRAADRRLVRLWPVGAVLWRMHRQGRPHRAVQLRYLQFDADQRDAEGRDRSSCRAAASGAASASRRSASRRPRCSTLISRRRGSESARCRCGIKTSPSPDSFERRPCEAAAPFSGSC